MEAVLYLVLTFILFSPIANSVPVVTSPWGTVEGFSRISADGQPYNSYLGIPYAVPPVGDLRFKKPQPHPGTKGTFKASSFGPACPQHGSMVQDEDCLTLNVFQPPLTAGRKVPVMVWIHGGGFEFGSAIKYNPWKMVTEGEVIVVTIQYRLNVLGFLSTESQHLPGNYALWDMRLALQWVKGNIDSYGGNASDVTIFGESAGSKAVSYLFLSHHSKDLFQKGIMQSGSATGYFSFRSNPREVAIALAIRIKCIPENAGYNADNQVLADCFRNTSTPTLIHNSDPSLGLAYFSADFTWSPVVDHDFLPDSPRNLFHNVSHLESVGFYDKDLMVGVNNQEGGYMVGRAVQYGTIHHTNGLHDMITLQFYRTQLLPLILTRLCGTFDNGSVDLIMNAYIPPNSRMTSLLSIYDVMNTQSDASIVSSSIEVANAHGSVTNRGRTYFYLFDHYPAFLANDSGLKGMAHGRDIMYSFGLNDNYVQSHFHTHITDDEYRLATTFVAIYTNFAKNSDPNMAIKRQLSRDWPQYDGSSHHFLSLSTKMAVKSHVYPSRVSTWLKDLPNADPHCRVGNTHHSSNPIIG